MLPPKPRYLLFRHDVESGDARLVFVNRPQQSDSYMSENGEDQVLAAIGEYGQKDGSITLAPYSGVILQSGQTR